MAKKPTFQQRFGFTPGKLILVLLLGSVFIGVIYFQFFAGTEAPAKSAKGKKTKQSSSSQTKATSSPKALPSQGIASNRQVAKTTTPPQSSASTKNHNRLRSTSQTSVFSHQAPQSTRELVAAVQSIQIRQWPAVNLDSALSHDPFAMSAALKEIAIAPVVIIGSDKKVVLLEEIAKRKKEAERLLAKLKKDKADARALRLAEARADFEAKVEAEQKRIEATIDRLQNNGIPIVMVSAKSRVVQIDSKVYQEQDTFEGIRIQEIRDDGQVTLVQAEPPATFVPPPELLEEFEDEEAEQTESNDS